MSERTSRGFPAPEDLPERTLHDHGDTIYPVRLTRWERRHLRLGEGLWGKFVFVGNDDGTYDLVRYAEVEGKA